MLLKLATSRKYRYTLTGMDINAIKPIWFNPCYAIYNFRQLTSKIGIKAALQKKKEFEAYITAIALLGVRHYEGRIWWLQIPEKDPPDAFAATMSLNKRKIGILNIQIVEIFRIEDYRKEEILEAIERKIKNKAYDPKTTLVGLINRDEKMKDLNILHLEIKKLNPKISSIWIVGNIDPIQSNYIVAQLFPDIKSYKINIDEECKNLRKFGTLMRTTRSMKQALAVKVQIRKREAPLLIPGGTY